MKRYDSINLGNPATYAADPELAKLAKDTANFNYFEIAVGKMSMAEFRQRVGSGEYPELMIAAVNKAVDDALASEKSAAAAEKAAASLVAPAGYTLARQDGDIVLSGPWSDDLHARIKRAGGRWDGATGQNRRCWLIPAAKAATLKRIFSNLTKSAEKAAAEKAAADKKAAVERGERQAIREREMLLIKEQARQQRETERQERARRAQHRVLFPVEAAPRLNTPTEWRGQVVVFESFGESFRISEEHPSLHGHHLLGHEGDKGRYYYYRPATSEEIAELEQAKAAAQAAADAKAARMIALQSIATEIRENGEHPDDQLPGQGDKITLIRDDAYGGGAWFVVETQWIWFCQGNSRDGDDWSRNNLPGVIGWRVPHTPELEQRLRSA